MQKKFKFFLFFLVTILFLTIISIAVYYLYLMGTDEGPEQNSFEFDQVNNLHVNTLSQFKQEYNNQSKTMTLRNKSDDKIITSVKLETPLEFQVPRGYNKVAEFTIDSKQFYKNFFDKIDFYRKKNMAKINRSFDFKIKVVENITIPDYAYNCTKVNHKNKSVEEKCIKIINGSHIGTKITWVPFKNHSISKEKMTLGIFTDVQKGDHIEWVPTLFGVEIDEWASWTESLNTDLIAYWTFNESSGTAVLESVEGVHNGTTAGSPPWVSGKIGNALDYTPNDYTEVIKNSSFYCINHCTINLWINADTYSGATPANILNYAKYGGGFAGWYVQGKNSILYINFDGTTVSEHSEHITGRWFMLTAVYNGTDNILYVNGTQVDTDSANAASGNSVTNINFARSDEANGEAFNGKIDETSFWNRSLSASEISDLFNNGDGLTYTDEFPEGDSVAPNITINIPINSTYTTSSIDFNITAVDDTLMEECWLYLDGAGDTNYTMTNDTHVDDYNLTNGSIGDGDYTINFFCNDSSSNLNDSETQTFHIDSILPDIQFDFPTNTTYTINVSDINYTYTETNPDSCWYSLDLGDTNSSREDCGTNWTGLSSSEGDNIWYVYINDTSGNINQTIITFHRDTIYPIISLVFPVDVNYTSDITELNYTSDGDYCFYSLDDGDTNSTAQVVGTNWTGLSSSEGDNTWRVYCNDSLGNLNDTEFRNFHKDTVPPSFANHTTEPSNNTEYNSDLVMIFNITLVEIDGGSVGAWFNGTNVSGDITNDGSVYQFNVSNYSAGDYELNWTAWDDLGNQNFSSVQYFTIAKNSSSTGVLASTEGWSVDYAKTITISLTETNDGDGDITYEIFRDGASVGTGETVNLSVGTYEYILNSTEGQNYTSNSSLNGSTLTINQIASVVKIYLNNTNGNITISNGTFIDINGTREAGEGNLEIYYDEILFNSGSPPLYNSTNFSTAEAVHNFTVIHPATTNFTRGVETYWLNVSNVSEPDTTAPTFDNLQNHSTAANVSFSFDLDASDNVVVGTFVLNDTDTFNITWNTGVIVNVTSLEEIGIHWLNVSVNDTAGNIAWGEFFINVTEEVLVLTIHNPTNSSYDSSGVDLNVSASGAEVSSYWYSLDDGTNVTFTPNTTMHSLGWEAYHTVRVYANDTNNNVVSELRRFYVGSYWKVGFIAGLVGLIGIYAAMGFFIFDKKYWLIKSLFFFYSLGLLIVMINSARIMGVGSKTDTILTTAFIISIVSLSVMLLYLFVFAFIEIIKILKDRRELRWG